jgi:hypothetical protein
MLKGVDNQHFFVAEFLAPGVFMIVRFKTAQANQPRVRAKGVADMVFALIKPDSHDIHLAQMAEKYFAEPVEHLVSGREKPGIVRQILFYQLPVATSRIFPDPQIVDDALQFYPPNPGGHGRFRGRYHASYKVVPFLLRQDRCSVIGIHLLATAAQQVPNLVSE